MNEQKIKEKYYEYQMTVQQIQQLQQNISNLEKHITELNKIDDNIETITKVELNQETLIPMGNGLFIKGTIKDTSKFIMNVGSGVCVEKTSEEARITVKKQLDEVSTLTDNMKVQVEELIVTIQELQEEIEKMKPE
ncbi:MAG: prefoldin subunit alpha [Nanoarchaeota archaeon]